MIYGYVRVSTKKQSIERQINNIKAVYPHAVIFSEKISGTTLNRVEFQKLLKAVKKDDTIIFDSVSRMSRNAQEGFSVYQKLFEKGVNLEFIKEPYINTCSYKKALQGTIDNVNTGTASTNKLVNGILEAINQFILEKVKEDIIQAFKQSEKEVTDLQERTKEGLAVAKSKGITLGRTKGAVIKQKKEKPLKELIQRYSKDFNGTNNDIDLIAIINSKTIEIDGKRQQAHISRNTLYKYKRELKELIA
jgi:DNA invertase Pin-like site-specific DNA recombinase